MKRPRDENHVRENNGSMRQIRAVDVYSKSFGKSDKVTQQKSDILEFRSAEEAELNFHLIRYVSRTVKKVGCAFCNTNGGDIFFGIRNSGIVSGLSLTLDVKKKLKRTIYETISNLHPSAPDFFGFGFGFSLLVVVSY